MAFTATVSSPASPAGHRPESAPAPAPSSANTDLNSKPASARENVILGRAATIGEGLNWITITALVLFHLGAIAALFMFTWQRLVVAIALYVLSINVGIGMCYHRLLTHRGYQVPKWLEYAMTVCATLALEGGPIFWVSTHRVHHQFSDQEGDPHSPRDGGFWAHSGWILFGQALAAQTSTLARYSPDLAKDRFHVWISKYHWLPLVVCGVLLFGIGWYFGGPVNAIGMLLWGAALRVTFGQHATWFVNSAAHIWGSRRFTTRDTSRNNWWVALISGGEGWHNNHHAHPVSAKHGLAWYEVDPNFWGIWMLSKLGLAKKIQIAKFDPKDPRPAGA